MNENYTFWLTVAVVLGAAALVVQAACLYALYKTVSRLQARTMEFMPKAEATLVHVENSLNQSRADMKEIATKANAVMDLAQGQLTRVDHFVSETTGRARAQIERAEALIDESLGRVRHTVDLVSDTVSRPVREVNAVSAGLRAALGSFFSKRSETARAYGDDSVDRNGNGHERAEQPQATVSED